MDNNTKTCAFNAINQVEGFNPMDYARETLDWNGNPSLYLDVKHRISWFRLVYPQGRISTKIINITDHMAVVEACVYSNAKDAVNEYLSNGHGQRFHNINDAADARFLEIAETGAIGRALAAAGFNIQGETDTNSSEETPVDAPISQSNQVQSTTEQSAEVSATDSPSNPPEQQQMTSPQSQTSDTRTVEEILATMTLESAKACKISFGKQKGKTLGQVAMENASNIEWIANEYSGKDLSLKAGAMLLLKAGQKMAG
ncbi:MAG: hypothetical protein FWE05_12715 [Defluviitaleaceae bacterium]|nr:hypothetical protein [Defluviitaleaceae bacterium]